MSQLDLTLGCMMIGYILNVWLYGASCVQAFFYFTRFPNDTKFMRCFCGYLMIADTLNTVLISHSMYDYLVTGFGDFTNASQANWSFNSDPVMVSIIALSCQGFFAWRVKKLTHSYVVATIAMLFALASFACSIATSYKCHVVKYFVEFQDFQVYVILWLAFATVADILITGALVHTLRKSKTGFQSTDQLVHRLVRSTIQTNGITTLFQVTDLILFTASTTSLHFIFNFPLGKLYINSLFSTLNARAYMRGWGSSASGGYPSDMMAMDGISDSQSRSQKIGQTRTGKLSIGTKTIGGSIRSPSSPGHSPSNFSFSPTRKHFSQIGTASRHDRSQVQVTTIEERFEGLKDSDLENALNEEGKPHYLSSPPTTPGLSSFPANLLAPDASDSSSRTSFQRNPRKSGESHLDYSEDESKR